MNSGVALAQEAGQALADIAESVIEMVEGSAGIAHASDEQSTGVSEITNAINKFDGANQKNIHIKRLCDIGSDVAHATRENWPKVSVCKTLPDENGWRPSVKISAA